MRPAAIYALLCVLGTILPMTQLVPFLLHHGLDPRLFCQQLFANRISGFFAWDVVVSTLALWAVALIEGKRAGVPALWAPFLASLTVGVSLGLPLFLYLRERTISVREA